MSGSTAKLRTPGVWLLIFLVNKTGAIVQQMAAFSHIFIMQGLNFLKGRIFQSFLFCAALVFSSRADTAINRFGFSGPEIFPIDAQISQLRAADINGDGKLDLVLANNSRAKINILINQTGE